MFERISEDGQGAIDDPEEARRFAAEVANNLRRFDVFLKRLDRLGVRGRLLDVGAGSGMLAVLIAERYPDICITAIDISPAMTEIARRTISERGLADRIECLTGDGLDPSVLAGLGSFDLVYCAFTLHHFADPLAAVRTMLDAAGDTGTVYLYDLLRVGWLHWIPKRNGFLDSIRAAYRVDEAKRMFAPLGRKLEVAKRFPFLLEVLLHPSE